MGFNSGFKGLIVDLKKNYTWSDHRRR